MLSRNSLIMIAFSGVDHFTLFVCLRILVGVHMLLSTGTFFLGFLGDVSGEDMPSHDDSGEDTFGIGGKYSGEFFGTSSIFSGSCCNCSVSSESSAIDTDFLFLRAR
uniref:Uncharacterized protein n=1 Tax=Cacopsylla melanoneura TaxID=428564 RepID=A0A8D8YNU9_9HEMI